MTTSDNAMSHGSFLLVTVDHLGGRRSVTKRGQSPPSSPQVARAIAPPATASSSASLEAYLASCPESFPISAVWSALGGWPPAATSAPRRASFWAVGLWNPTPSTAPEIPAKAPTPRTHPRQLEKLTPRSTHNQSPAPTVSNDARLARSGRRRLMIACMTGAADAPTSRVAGNTNHPTMIPAPAQKTADTT